MLRNYMKKLLGIAIVLATASACGGDEPPVDVYDPDTAPVASVDRFSAEAGTLMVRDANNGLPEADQPIDYDQAPFMTQGLTPDGQVVTYYNFDVQPTEPAPIFVMFREGEDTPVSGQLNIVDVIPGGAGYNDFWQVNKVIVPADYVANSMASLADINASGYPIEPTETLVNCPVVPAGSTAAMRVGGGSPGLTRGWYQGQVVSYFSFEEAPLSGAIVPTSPIYVTFNINPDQPDGGPPSGFVTEPDGVQTHNVLGSVPGQAGYSPLWSVVIYDNADFDNVSDLTSAMAATTIAGGPNVNCPLASL
jgi:hypothetical protein